MVSRIDNNRVNSAFYLGMGYMRISLKSPTALSFGIQLFSSAKKKCVCGGGGGAVKCHTSRKNISSEKKTDTTKLV